MLQGTCAMQNGAASEPCLATRTSQALHPTCLPAFPLQQDLKGVYSAREFVWWYNGHPHYAGLPIDLSKTRRVAICGLGNVAVDCARVLLQVGPLPLVPMLLMQMTYPTLLNGEEEPASMAAGGSPHLF